MRLLWLLLSVGCNDFYGLDATRSRDAAPKVFFDTPPDAPYACPGPGTAPRFRAQLGQLPVPDCRSYTPSHDWKNALAECPTMGIMQGPLDGPLSVTISTDAGYLFEPRLFPEGDRMFVKDAVANRVDIYTRTGTTWSSTSTIRGTASGDWYISNPSRGPDRRAIVIEYTLEFGYAIIELVEQGGTWTPKPAYKLNNVTFGAYPSLSSDGLRMVFQATPIEGSFYAARATLDDPFDQPVALTTVPKQAAHPFLEDDCSRIYFSALSTVLYLTQE